MTSVLSRLGHALRYAYRRGRKAVGAALGAFTASSVTALAAEWFDIELAEPVAGMVAMAAAALGAWLMPANAEKGE